MADGKIYITISDTRGGSTGGEQLSSSSNPAVQQQTTKKSGSSDLQKILALKAFDTTISIAEQAVGYSISNIGNFTGNYQAQRDIQTVLGLGNELVSLGNATATGASVGGWAGAILFATAHVALFSVNKVLEIEADKFNNRRINRNIDYMRNRLGLDGLTNGSRSGGY